MPYHGGVKALRLNDPGPIADSPLQLVEIPAPEPGAGEVLIRVAACGLCHTDLHCVEGDLPLPKLPVVPGHQVVGVVQGPGNGTGWPRVGDRVGVTWLNWACGECIFCRTGKENLCPAGRFTGYHVDGGYAQYVLAPCEFVYPVPEGIPDHQAAPLLCGGVIGYRALKLSEVQPGQALGLYGFGSSAHMVIQIARHWGCRVYVFTRSAEHQRLARELGAAWVGQAQDTTPKLMDSSIIFAPAGALVPDALRALKNGGTLALAGITMTPIPEMPYHLVYGEKTVRSVANATRDDARRLLELAVEIPIRTEVQQFRLEEANRALMMLKKGRINGAGVLVVSEE